MKNPADISGVFPCGQWPLTISHGGLLRVVTSLTRPVSAACRRTFSLFTLHSSLFPKKARSCYCGGNRGIDQSPPCQRGVVWQSQTGGIPWPKPRNLFTIHFSLFPKNALPLSTLVGTFEKAPTVNPSVAFGASSLWQGSLFVPGIVLWCDTGLFPSSNRQRGEKTAHKPTTQNGGRG